MNKNYKYHHNMRKRLHLDITMLLLTVILLIYSCFVVWSASDQNISIMTHKMVQILIGLLVMFTVSQIKPRYFEKWSLFLYIFCVFLLILVTISGNLNKGAQRWLNIGIIRFQPSEIAKIAVPLMIAKCINQNSYPPSIKTIIISLVLILIPTILVGSQPDLGTAILIFFSGCFILFLSGMDWKSIFISITLLIILLPMMWFFCMHDYQRERIMILINPHKDPLGSGYHIIQSKIAIGSGGFFGKGWLQGTQSHLEFLPERHTDFIFSVLSEEFGFIGVLILLGLYTGIIIRGFIIAMQAQNIFCKVIAGGLMLLLFICIFINISMVSGILPVVGIPLPLVSYGGSALVVSMTELGIVMSIHNYRKNLSKNL